VEIKIFSFPINWRKHGEYKILNVDPGKNNNLEVTLLRISKCAKEKTILG